MRTGLIQPIYFANLCRWIFIIEGVVTIVAGFIAPFFLVECTYITMVATILVF